MPFSDFKAIPDVQERFKIRHVENDFISTRSELGKLVVGTPLIMLVEARRTILR